MARLLSTSIAGIFCTFPTMSSLKDIMDVDVEPLESQAMRSRQAIQEQNDLDQTGSSTNRSAREDTKQQPRVDRWRSPPGSSKSSSGAPSRPSLSRRQSSGTAESLESDSNPAGNSRMADSAGFSRPQSHGLNPPESVRYTPVTGRVSRAKKGQPVHVCQICDPPRV